MQSAKYSMASEVNNISKNCSTFYPLKCCKREAKVVKRPDMA